MMAVLYPFLHWLAQHPLGTATMIYATSVMGILVYAYFEPRTQS